MYSRKFLKKKGISTTIIMAVVVVVVIIAAGAAVVVLRTTSTATTGTTATATTAITATATTATTATATTAITATATTATTATVATTVTATTSEAPVTLTVWETYAPGPGEDQAFNQTISTFESVYPWITLDVQAQPFSSAESDYITASLANQAPDVLRAANDWTGSLVAQGFLQSIGPYTNSSFLAQYTTGSIGAYSINGQLYGLGENTNGLAMLYNKAIFSADGISGPPTTTDQLNADLATILKDNSSITPITFSTGSNSEYWWLPFLFGFGGQIFTPGIPPVPTINSTAAVNATQYINSLISAGYLPLAPSDSETAFCDGNAAMTIDGPWDASTYNSCSGLSWAAAPLPNVSSTGLPIAPTWGYQGWVMSSGLPLNVQQAAFDFMAWVTSYTAQENLFNYALDLPTNIALATSTLVTGNATAGGFAAQALTAANAYGYNSAAMNDVWGPLGTALGNCEGSGISIATIQAQLDAAETSIIQAGG